MSDDPNIPQVPSWPASPEMPSPSPWDNASASPLPGQPPVPPAPPVGPPAAPSFGAPAFPPPPGGNTPMPPPPGSPYQPPLAAPSPWGAPPAPQQDWAQPQPSGYQPYAPGQMPMGQTSPFESRATTVLVLGILGLVFCQLLAPVAWVMGRSLKADAERAGWPEPGTGKAGRICGLIGTIIIGFFVVLFLVALIAGIASGPSTSSGY